MHLNINKFQRLKQMKNFFGIYKIKYRIFLFYNNFILFTLLHLITFFITTYINSIYSLIIC